MSAPQPARPMDGRAAGAVVTGFIGAFLLGLAATSDPTNMRLLLYAVGVLLVLFAVGLAIASIRERRAASLERTEWPAFERALTEGVRFDVPEGMGYATSLPAALEDLADVDEPADGEARRAIVGEEGEIHWCAFQHERASGTTTVGLVGLHPDREADTYPRLAVRVADPLAEEFDERFSVACEDDAIAAAVLGESARAELLGVEPFDWRLEGNQLITSIERPSTPQEAIAFIEQRLLPLARVATAIPLDA